MSRTLCIIYTDVILYKSYVLECIRTLLQLRLCPTKNPYRFTLQCSVGIQHFSKELLDSYNFTVVHTYCWEIRNCCHTNGKVCQISTSMEDVQFLFDRSSYFRSHSDKLLQQRKLWNEVWNCNNHKIFFGEYSKYKLINYYMNNLHSGEIM